MTTLLQDKLFKGHQMSIFNQMLYVNVCSAIVSFSGMSSPAAHWHSTQQSSLDTCCMLIIVNFMYPVRIHSHVCPQGVKAKPVPLQQDRVKLSVFINLLKPLLLFCALRWLAALQLKL